MFDMGFPSPDSDIFYIYIFFYIILKKTSSGVGNSPIRPLYATFLTTLIYLGYVHALLDGDQLRHQLSHVFACNNISSWMDPEPDGSGSSIRIKLDNDFCINKKDGKIK